MTDDALVDEPKAEPQEASSREAEVEARGRLAARHAAVLRDRARAGAAPPRRRRQHGADVGAHGHGRAQLREDGLRRPPVWPSRAVGDGAARDRRAVLRWLPAADRAGAGFGRMADDRGHAQAGPRVRGALRERTLFAIMRERAKRAAEARMRKVPIWKRRQIARKAAWARARKLSRREQAIARHAALRRCVLTALSVNVIASPRLRKPLRKLKGAAAADGMAGNITRTGVKRAVAHRPISHWFVSRVSVP